MKEAFNLTLETCKYSEEMLARKDIDGMVIATGDFQHAKLCAEVVRAGKDCYVEKPFANVFVRREGGARRGECLQANGPGWFATSQRSYGPAFLAATGTHRSSLNCLS